MDDQDDPLFDLNDLSYELARWVDAAVPKPGAEVEHVHLHQLLDKAYEALASAQEALGDIQ